MGRFTFPPINMGAPIEPQLTFRAEWVGYKLMRIDATDTGLRWKLFRCKRVFILDSLCEVEMRLATLLEEIGDRVEKEQLDRMIAERAVAREVHELMSGLPATGPKELQIEGT